MPAVIPQMWRSSYGISKKVRRAPFQTRLPFRWLAGSIRKESGTSKTSATSAGLSFSAKPGLHHRDDERDVIARAGQIVGAAADRLDESPAARPISSSASRSAAASGPASSGSMRPPGKAICPACARRSPGPLGEEQRRLRLAMDDRHEHRRRPPLDVEQLLGDLRIEDVVADMRLGRERAARRRGGGNPPPKSGAAQPRRRAPGKAKNAPSDQTPSSPSRSSAMADELERDGARGERFEPAADLKIRLQPVRPRLRRRSAADARGRRRRCRRHWCGR